LYRDGVPIAVSVEGKSISSKRSMLEEARLKNALLRGGDVQWVARSMGTCKKLLNRKRLPIYIEAMLRVSISG